jgi:hypothetical protein
MSFEVERAVQTLFAQLSRYHFIEIIYLMDPLQRQFCAEMAKGERWSVRTLEKEDPGHALRAHAISKA